MTGKLIFSRASQVIKMLIVVVVVFIVSWLPLQTFSMVIFLFPELRQDVEYQSLEYNIFVATYFVCHWLSMMHSCANPLIYCFMNDTFRDDLRDLFVCCSRHTMRPAIKLGCAANGACTANAHNRSTRTVDTLTSTGAVNGGGGGGGVSRATAPKRAHTNHHHETSRNANGREKDARDISDNNVNALIKFAAREAAERAHDESPAQQQRPPDTPTATSFVCVAYLDGAESSAVSSARAGLSTHKHAAPV